jgi:hypothetical protein
MIRVPIWHARGRQFDSHQLHLENSHYLAGNEDFSIYTHSAFARSIPVCVQNGVVWDKLGVIMDNVDNTFDNENRIYDVKNHDFPKKPPFLRHHDRRTTNSNEKDLFFYGGKAIVTLMRFGKISAILFGVTAATFVLMTILQPG